MTAMTVMERYQALRALKNDLEFDTCLYLVEYFTDYADNTQLVHDVVSDVFATSDLIPFEDYRWKDIKQACQRILHDA